MSQIEAIYQGGVFRPLQQVSLPENQRVRLEVQAVQAADAAAWLAEARDLQERVRRRFGDLPDSAPDIAADRGRDV